MASPKVFTWQILSILSVFYVFVSSKSTNKPVELTEDTWADLLEGEWLVELYAPWCPACKNLQPIWEKVAGWSDDLDIQVGKIDVTANPGLSGRFLVTALPTILHVKNGEFRKYTGPRDENEFVSYVDEKKWEKHSPVPWYYHPTSAHMGTLSYFFKLSIAIRDLHSKMTSDYGIPVWGSYTIFAIATIIAGLILGLCVVCMCDFCFPPRPRSPPPQQYRPLNNRKESDDESDVIKDDREKESEEEKEASDSASGGDVSRPKSATGARKRAPRKE